MSVIDAILFLSLVIGVYELITGKLPGTSRKSFLYRRANSPTALRIGAGTACLIIFGLIIRYKPESLTAYVGAFIGVLVGLAVIIRDIKRRR